MNTQHTKYAHSMQTTAYVGTRLIIAACLLTTNTPTKGQEVI